MAKTKKKNGNVLREGTPEFAAACRERLDKVAEKYARTAQHAGIILRRNPLKLAPYQDYVFNRISRSDYGFRYIDRAGREKIWFPDAGRILGGLDEPEGDFGFIMAERVEFLPGEPEVTHDAIGCRVLNLWRPPLGGTMRAAPNRMCSWSTLHTSSTTIRGLWSTF
jgi:hypothetical protein